MLTLCGLLCVGLTGWLLVAAAADQAVPMSTVTRQLAGEQGAVRGNYDQTAWTGQSFMQFRGIPYAEAPIGELRFKVRIRFSHAELVQLVSDNPRFMTVISITPYVATCCPFALDGHI